MTSRLSLAALPLLSFLALSTAVRADPTPAPASASASAVVYINLDGTLPADLGTGTFKLLVTLDGVPASVAKLGDNDPNDPVKQLQARMAVSLPSIGTTSLPVTATGAAAPAGASFVVQEYQPHDEFTNGDTTEYYRYYLQITEATVGALEAKAANGTLSIQVTFSLGGRDGALVASATSTLTQVPNLADAVPQTPGAIPQAGGLEVVWAPKGAVTTISGTYPQEPAQVNVWAVSPALGDKVKLPAKRLPDSPGGAETAGHCDFYPGPDQCIDCPDDGNYYLDAAAAASMAGVAVTTAGTADGLATLTGLTSGAKYTIFLQFAPASQNPSQCMYAFPL